MRRTGHGLTHDIPLTQHNTARLPTERGRAVKLLYHIVIAGRKEGDNPRKNRGLLENPGADDPWGQVDLTPEAKIGMAPLPKIKMTPVDIEPPGDFICIFGFRFGRRGIKPKKHEYKVKKHSPVSRIGNGNKKHQQCF